MTHCLYAKPKKGDVSSYLKVFIFAAWKMTLIWESEGTWEHCTLESDGDNICFLLYSLTYLCLRALWFFFFFLIFIYLAALGLSCGTQDLHCGTRDLLLWGSLQLWHMGSRMDRLSSCPTVFGTLVLPREIKAGSHALETRGHSHWTTLCFLSLFHTLKILLFLGPCHIFLCVTSTPDKIGKCLKLE